MPPYEGSLAQALWWHTLFGVLLYVIWRLTVPCKDKERGPATREGGPGAETGSPDSNVR